MSNKIQTGKFFGRQRKGKGFSSLIVGDPLREMRIASKAQSDAIKQQAAREKVRADQQISDQKNTHSNIIENRRILKNLENQKDDTQLKAIQTNKARDLQNYNTRIAEAQQEEERARYFTETGAKQWKNIADTLMEARDILKGKEEIRKAKEENRYNDQVEIGKQAEKKVSKKLTEVVINADTGGDRKLVNWLFDGKIFRTNFAKKWQAEQLLLKKDVLFGKIEELRVEKKIGRSAEETSEFYEYAANKVLNDLKLSAFTESGKKLYNAIISEGTSLASHTANTQRHGEQLTKYNLNFDDLAFAVNAGEEPQVIQDKFYQAAMSYKAMEKINIGGRQWINNPVTGTKDAGLYVLKEIVKADYFISLGQEAGAVEIGKFLESINVLDDKGKPTKFNWGTKWKETEIRRPVLKAFNEAILTAKKAELEKLETEDKIIKVGLINDTIFGEKIDFKSVDGLRKVYDLQQVASKKGYTKTTAYIKNNFPFLQDAISKKINWNKYIEVVGAWEERDLAQLNVAIKAIDDDVIEKKLFNHYYNQAWAINKGNLTLGEFDAAGIEIVGQTLGIFDPKTLTDSHKRTAVRIGKYASAVYFRKAAILKEKGSVKIGKVTVENAEDLKEEVKKVVKAEVAEGKNNAYSIWHHRDAGEKLQNSVLGGSIMVGRNPLGTEFTYDSIGYQTTESTLSENLSQDNVDKAVPGALNNLNQLDSLFSSINTNDSEALQSAISQTKGLAPKTDDYYASNLLNAELTADLVRDLSEGRDIINIPRSVSKFVKSLPLKKNGMRWTAPELLNHIFEKRDIKLRFLPSLESHLINAGYTGTRMPDNPDDVLAIMNVNRYKFMGTEGGKLNELPTTGAIQLYKNGDMVNLKEMSTERFNTLTEQAGHVLICNPKDGTCKSIIPQLPKKFENKVAGK
tara:strand:+ start:764 stop:3502 length:2739 start_codon:yes stop_codon:yes gene_type:complete